MFRKLGIASIAVAILSHLFSVNSAHAQAGSGLPPRARITQAIDEERRVVLQGNTRPEVNQNNDRGKVADDFPMEHMLLQLQRSSEQEQALQQFLDDLHRQGSPDFHRWITAQEFGARFGVAEEDLNTITRWLESHRFKVNLVYPSHMVIDFSGTAGQVREAFQTEIHALDVQGEKHVANTSDPRIPAALSAVVAGVVSLHDFRPHPMHRIRSAQTEYTFTDALGNPTYAVVPADLATIYNLNPLFKAGYSGQGQTIVLIEDTDVFSAADWSTFRTTFGLSSYTSATFSQTHPGSNCRVPGVISPNDAEAILDAEWASASAPNAAIVMAACADTSTTFGGLIALQNLINASSQPPAIMSISYGQCETVNGSVANAAYNSAYQQAVSEGVSVFVAAGDSGAAGCDNQVAQATHGIGVNAFASTPYNVAVGGTDFSDTYSGTNSAYWSSTNTSVYGSALSYVPEIPWNDSCAGVLLSNSQGFSVPYGPSGLCNDPLIGALLQTTVAGGGGPSQCATGAASIAGVVSGSCKGWPKPSWQSVVGNPPDGVRDTPDVSLFAADGLWGHFYVFCWSNVAKGGAACTGAPSSWSGAGGTSFAAPILAGIQALINQKAGGPQGNPNPVYYQLAATEYGTTGSSSCNSSKGTGVASTCTFYDVTEGDMDVDCGNNYNCFLDGAPVGVLSTSNTLYQPAYGTSVGWDFATGIGTINAANLVNNWRTSTALPSLTTISPSSGQQGQTINTVTLTGSNLSGAAINSLNGITMTNVVATATQVTATFSIAANAPLGPQNVTVNTAKGTSNSVTFTVNAAAPPAPTLSSLNPSSNVQGAMFTDTLMGTNFIAGAKINIAGSGVSASNVTVVNSTSITATFTVATNATLGAHNVSVTTSGGTSGTVAFTVNPAPGPPTLTAISPGYVAQGTSPTFTLTGTNFVPGNTTINNSYTGLSISNVMVVSSTSLTATFTVAANAPIGSTTFSVTTPSGTSGNNVGIDVIGVPILTSISPNNGNRGTAFTVTLTGSKFLRAQIKFSGTGITASNRTVNFPMFTVLTYTFTIASNAPTGPQNVTLTNAAGTSAPMAFTVNGGTPVPTLTNISPNSGQTGQVVSPVNMTGTNLTGATVNAPTGITASGVSSTSTTVTATFTIASNAPTGPQNVTVTTAGGTSNAVTFTVNAAPTITSANNTTFVVGTFGSFTVTSTGFPTPALTQTGATLPAGVTFVDNHNGTGTLSGTPGAGTGGVYNLTFTASNGVGPNAVQNFTLTVDQAPAITSANNTTFTVGTLGSFTPTATGFPAPSITESGALPAGVNFSGGVLSGTPGAGTGGVYNLTFTASNGVNPNAVQNFTLTVNVPPPTLTSLTTTHAAPGISGGILLSGTNFYAPATINVSGTGLTFSGISVVSTTSITANFAVAANAPPGAQNVSVTTPGGTSNAVVFTVDAPAPTLGSISPSSGLLGTNVNVTLSGTNFTSGASINFSGSGVTISNTAVVNSTTITASFAIAANAATGTQYVSVTTSAGTSGNVSFIVSPPPPTLTGLNPMSGIAGTAPSVTLTGTGFIAGQTTVGSSAQGILVTNVSVVSVTQLTATFNINASTTDSSSQITVHTPNGTSGAQIFTIYHVPTLTSVSPNSGSRGTNVNVTLTGSYFVSPVTVNFGGAGVVVTNVTVAGANTIAATFQISAGATTGAQNVSVTTPGGTSGVAVFTVN